MRGINRCPADYPHKRPVTRKALPCDDVFVHFFHDISDTMVRALALHRWRDDVITIIRHGATFVQHRVWSRRTKMHCILTLSIKFIERWYFKMNCGRKTLMPGHLCLPFDMCTHGWVSISIIPTPSLIGYKIAPTPYWGHQHGNTYLKKNRKLFSYL